jgi:hypothetical protein
LQVFDLHEDQWATSKCPIRQSDDVQTATSATAMSPKKARTPQFHPAQSAHPSGPWRQCKLHFIFPAVRKLQNRERGASQKIGDK